MSNTTKHTPGPWWPIHNGTYWDIKTWRDRDPQDIEPYDYGASIGCVFQNYTEERTRGKETEEANAYLIAAAPELLEAAKDVCGLLFSLDNVPDDHPAYQRLKEAIKKAQP